MALCASVSTVSVSWVVEWQVEPLVGEELEHSLHMSPRFPTQSLVGRAETTATYARRY
jgi:hypothetical protein